MLGLGVLLMVLGFIGLLTATILTIASVLFFGVLLLIAGGAQILHAFKCRDCGWRPMLSYAVLALLYLGTAVLILVDPVSASVALTLFLAGLLVGIGIIRIVFAFQNRGEGAWGWPLVGGLIAMALGALIFLQWPVSGLWVIGMFVAIDMMIQGSMLISVGLTLRRGERLQDQPAV